MKSKRYIRVNTALLLGTALVLAPGGTALGSAPNGPTGPDAAALAGEGAGAAPAARAREEGGPSVPGETAAAAAGAGVPSEGPGTTRRPGVGPAIPDTVRVFGVVLGPDGAPVEGANVFLLPDLEGAVTDGDGRFVIAVVGGDRRTLVMKARGLATVRREVTPPDSGLVLRPARGAVEVGGLDVTVGPPRAAVGKPEAEMTGLQVVRTPGAAGDPFRALQSEPGALAVDEGVGLHLQGGAARETRVLLDGVAMAAPFRTSSAAGLELGSVDPFLLEEITLATAGFDARVGDALSGVVRGRTRGRPEESAARISATAAGASGRLDLAAGDDWGLRLTGGFSDLGPLFAAHGRADEFLDVPRGEQGSVSLAWEPEPGTRLKLFALGRADRFASREEGRGPDAFRWDSDDHHAVLSGRTRLGPVSTSLALGATGADRARTFGTFRLIEDERRLQARGTAAWGVAPGVTLRGGAVLERRATDLEGRVSGREAAAAGRETETDPSGGAAGAAETETTAFASRIRAVRRGGFVQAEWEPGDLLGLKGGLRADHSTLTGSTTLDPRLTALLQPGDDVEVELAWGRYHQVPDLPAADATVGVADPEPMRATHWTAAVRGPGPGPVGRVRLRVYRKTYRDLVQEDRTHRHVAGGEGTATGAELRATAVAPGDVELQAAASVVDADRTDPTTGVVAPSPFEASPSATVQATRTWSAGFEVGLAYRYGRGRPFTPVVDARFDPDRGAWIPEFGPPRGERLPDLRRLDLSASWIHRFWDGDPTTVFLSVTNLLGRENVSAIRYNRDFSQRIAVPSTFQRTVFVGATTSFPF